MVYEKTKLTIRRVFWLIMLILGIAVPIVMSSSGDNPKLAKHIGSVSYYYEYLNETSYNIELTFDTDVSSVRAKVSFYDANGKLLATQTDTFWGYGKTASNTFYSVPGKAVGYKIVSYEAEADNGFIIPIFVFVDFIILAFLIAALLLSCKVYNYNGKQIVVYAGWYHHYIKIDGRKMDEHNTLVSFTAIYLSCTTDDGTNMQATISMTNRIALKINNQLYR